MLLKSTMDPNDLAILMHQIFGGGIFVASLILKTFFSAYHLTPEMLEPVTMINKPVDLLNNLDRMYAGVEYMYENFKQVTQLHIDGPLYFDHSTTLRNVE